MRSKGIRVLGVGVLGVLGILMVLWEASGRYLEGLWEASSGHLGTLGGLGALGTFEVHSLSLKWGQTAASDHSTAEWRRSDAQSTVKHMVLARAHLRGGQELPTLVDPGN